MAAGGSRGADRVGLVTGAGAGIGRATAERLLQDHAGVVVVDLTEDALAWAKGDDRYVAVVGGVSQVTTNESAAAAAVERFGRLDRQVLNAGVSWTGRHETMSIK